MALPLDYALEQDQKDPLKSYRESFLFPQHNDQPVAYFCGNSLGLQPKGVKQALLNELEQWEKFGVEGHFMGEKPWMHYHKLLTPSSALLVGALPHEVVVMNTLTVNLHLMMASFYQPTHQRFKIIMEAGAFPSDQYAVESQVKWHGFNPKEAIIEVAPREGEDILRTEDILQTIDQHGGSIALVLFGGVNYYTGQYYDLAAITSSAQRSGAYVGFDLAHAAGNVPLELHNWGPDFAVWCSYKYLNAGPGGPAGLFVHERHAKNPSLPRLAGWWGHDEKVRFQMKKGFVPMYGAEGWQLSNAQILSFAAHKVGLDLFQQAGMDNLRKKSISLTGFLEQQLLAADPDHRHFKIITPPDPNQRGCQLSILTNPGGKKLFDYLNSNGIVTDWREPNVIRVAPVPLYNSFEDAWKLAKTIKMYFNQ